MINIHNVHPVVSLLRQNRHHKVHAGAAKMYAKYAGHIFCDRIDIQLEVVPVPISELTKIPEGESSATIRSRVIEARTIQSQRFKGIPNVYCNAQMNGRMLREFAPLDAECLTKLNTAMSRLDLSARAYEKIVKIARTIADLDHSPQIYSRHITEAISYRNLDRSGWGE